MMGRLRESKWFYMLASIVLASIFWLYVRAVQDPTSPVWLYNIPVVQVGSNVLTQQNLTVAELSQETVNLRVEAPASVLDSLSRNRSEITVTLDVSKCQEGENRLTYVPNWPASVSKERIALLDQNPDSITVTVEKLSARTFQVEFQLKGKVASGYQVGTAAINPETVVVSGPVEQVSQVARVAAILEDENLNQQFAGDLPLTLFNAEGAALTDLDVTLDSQSVYVVLPVVVVKEIPLTVKFLYGGGVNSEENYTYQIEPDTITVSGAENDLRDLTEISLGSVDLSKVVGSTTFSRSIDLDPSLENVSGITAASISVQVSGLPTRTFEVDNISVSNPPKGYTAVPVTRVRAVNVRGEEAALELLDASQIRIVVDVSAYDNEGTYSIPARVYLDANNSVGVIGEYFISVSISKDK